MISKKIMLRELNVSELNCISRSVNFTKPFFNENDMFDLSNVKLTADLELLLIAPESSVKKEEKIIDQSIKYADSVAIEALNGTIRYTLRGMLLGKLNDRQTVSENMIVLKSRLKHRDLVYGCIITTNNISSLCLLSLRDVYVDDDVLVVTTVLELAKSSFELRNLREFMNLIFPSLPSFNIEQHIFKFHSEELVMEINHSNESRDHILYKGADKMKPIFKYNEVKTFDDLDGAPKPDSIMLSLGLLGYKTSEFDIVNNWSKIYVRKQK